jgi:hypothetical protein
MKQYYKCAYKLRPPLFLILRLPVFILVFNVHSLQAQKLTDTLPVPAADTALRIINLNPYFTVHVDSVLQYQFEINREAKNYHWFLKNSPVGLRVNKDNGLLTFKAEKSFFLSGRLKYDTEYMVLLGVQSLSNPAERSDTAFKVIFYSTEIIAPKLRPTIASPVTLNEGELLSFSLQCEPGSFPVENILFTSSVSLREATLVKACNDVFSWTPDYDFVSDADSAQQKSLLLSFTGNTRFGQKDTARIRVTVKNALNYPLAGLQYQQVKNTIQTYILRLKYSFQQIDKKLKRVKTVRTSFDLTSAGTALSGTVLNSSSSTQDQKTGKILPSVGVALVPIKEAVAANKVVEQNQASLIRTSIKRLEYLLQDNFLTGDKDPEILRKTSRLREELRQVQLQLIEIPVSLSENLSEEELNQYFNSPRVSKKYRIRSK